MIDVSQIIKGGYYSRANKVLLVIDIYKEYSSAYGCEIDMVEAEWALGKLKCLRRKMLIGQLAAWAEFVVDESRLPRHEELISDYQARLSAGEEK